MNRWKRSVFTSPLFAFAACGGTSPPPANVEGTFELTNFEDSSSSITGTYCFDLQNCTVELSVSSDETTGLVGVAHEPDGDPESPPEGGMGTSSVTLPFTTDTDLVSAVAARPGNTYIGQLDPPAK